VHVTLAICPFRSVRPWRRSAVCVQVRGTRCCVDPRAALPGACSRGTHGLEQQCSVWHQPRGAQRDLIVVVHAGGVGAADLERQPGVLFPLV
jgi:hypothetical protein